MNLNKQQTDKSDSYTRLVFWFDLKVFIVQRNKMSEKAQNESKEVHSSLILRHVDIDEPFQMARCLRVGLVDQIINVDPNKLTLRPAILLDQRKV